MLSRSNHGCRIGDLLFQYVMYADDLILMSASLCDLQSKVSTRVEELLSSWVKLSECQEISGDDAFSLPFVSPTYCL